MACFQLKQFFKVISIQLSLNNMKIIKINEFQMIFEELLEENKIMVVLKVSPYQFKDYLFCSY